MIRAMVVCVASVVGLTLAPLLAEASTLTWGGANTWATNETSNVYTVDGVQLTFTLSDPGSALDPNTQPLASPGSPSNSSYLDPTGNNGEESLFLKAPGNSVGIGLTITFDTLVTSVSFNTYDMDQSPPGNYTDILAVQAQNVSASGSPFNPTSVTGNGTESWFLQANGYTLEANANADQTGGNSANGTALWLFDAPLDTISLTYLNGDPAFGVQWMGLHSIDSQAVPALSLIHI